MAWPDGCTVRTVKDNVFFGRTTIELYSTVKPIFYYTTHQHVASQFLPLHTTSTHE